MGKTLHLHIVTPVAKVFDGDVEHIRAPGSEGYLGVLPGHTYLITSLRPGTLTFRVAGEEREYRVGTGHMEVRPEGVIVITEVAERLEAM